MFKNYFKLGFRNLKKNKLSSIINIGGLALAVGCCLTAFAFLDWVTHFDSFHSKRDRIFVVERLKQKEGSPQYYGNPPAPLGPMLKKDIPGVRNFARLTYEGVNIKTGNNVFSDNVTFVDDAFYSMFDFPVKWGDKKHFTDADGIVLTEELSKKLFGNDNPLGKDVSLFFSKKNGDRQEQRLKVKGVLDRKILESSFSFSALVPASKMAALGLDRPGDWSQRTNITFLEADNENAVLSIPGSAQNKKYISLYNAVNPDEKITNFYFQPLASMYLHSYKVDGNYFNAVMPAAWMMLLIIAIAILVLVYFNYMNIAIAAAASRLKEIGVRKVMGSNRWQIVLQFIVENLLLCSGAVIVGLVIAKLWFVPWFSRLGNVDLGQHLLTNYRIWAALVALILVSALSGAAYPSLYISSFHPISILKGKSKTGSKNRFRKVLLGFQFFLTFLAISAAIAFARETDKAKARPWGYEPSGNVAVTLDKSSSYSAFAAALKNDGKVSSVTGSVQPLGNYTKEIAIKSEGKEETVKSISVLPGFGSQLGIKMMKGRDLSDAFPTDQTDGAMVNQAFVHQMGWVSAVGKTFDCDHHTYTIVGETNDFNYEDFQYKVGPLIVLGCKPADVNFVYVKIGSGLFSNAHTEVKSVWQKLYPDLPFEYQYQDAVFDNYFSGYTQVSSVLSASSVIMIVISLSGIFGLALLILGKKMKEISVRKVLGAGIGDIVYLINREFLFALGVALVLGFPFSFWLTGEMFGLLSSESNVSVVPLIASFLFLMVTTMGTLSWHIWRAHVSKPTKYLKEE